VHPLSGRTEYVPGRYFTGRVPACFRTDGSIYYKFNRKSHHAYFKAAALKPDEPEKLRILLFLIHQQEQ
jgi:hypothetical protein